MVTTQHRHWKTPLRPGLVLLAGLSMLMACQGGVDDPEGSPNTSAADAGAVATVQPEEEVAITAGDVTLEIPAGAVSKRVSVSVEPVGVNLPSTVTALSQVYRFEPEGLKFLLPATVHFELSKADGDAAVFWTDSEGSFQNIGGTVKGSSVSAEISHFSLGFGGWDDVDLADGGSVDPDSDGSTASRDGGSLDPGVGVSRA